LGPLLHVSAHLPLRGREVIFSFAHSKYSFPLRGKVGMGILYCATPVLSFPLRGKVGMGVVHDAAFRIREASLTASMISG